MPGLYIMSLPALVLERWRAQLESLPPKKQESWKTSVKDKHGTLRRIRFHVGEFQAKCHASHAKKDHEQPMDGWAPVCAVGSMPTEAQIQASYGHVFTERGIPEVVVESKETAELREALAECGLTGLEFELLKAEIIRQMHDANHTGNHRRNRTLAVPTAAGQPVRG